MKTTTLLSIVSACSLCAFSLPLYADDHHGDDGQGDDDQGQNEDCQGGHIDGSETLIASVDLVATTNAPADAGGFARLRSENEDGVVTSSLSLLITNLPAGTYTLSIVKKSDGSTVDLGQFQIGSCGDGDDEGDDNEGDDDS